MTIQQQGETAVTASTFVRPNAVSADYFRPGAYAGAYAVVLKPRAIMPTGGDGKSEVLCSALVFDTEQAVDDRKPSRVLPDTIVNVGVVYKQLVRTFDVDGVLAGRVTQGRESRFGTKPWVIESLDECDQERVEQAWLEMTA
jgi:hypothetical protein